MRNRHAGHTAPKNPAATRGVRQSRTLNASLATCAAVALAATSLVAASALSASAAPTSIGGAQQTDLVPGRYIVTLVDPSVATYRGGIEGYSATKPDTDTQLNARATAAQSYSDYLTDAQQDVAVAADVKIEQSYTLALNAFSATLSTAQLANLKSDKSVASLLPDELMKTAATPSTSFLGLDGDDGVWAKIGGLATAGEGIVLGSLDTGIAPENPAFAGAALGTAAGADPYREGTATKYLKADGATFSGECVTGDQFTSAECNTKVISARYFVDGFGAGRIGTPATGEYASPRDGDGHGSHTSSTAAGNARVPAQIDGTSYGTITGVAPAAKIAVYKVCWSGPDPTVSTDDGCATSDLLAAIDQAVADGVDVINYSIGGGAAQTTVSATDQAFLGAAAAGIFVAASAGNSGPQGSTLDNAAPWITTVAASTIPSYEATVTLGDGAKYGGASVTVDTTEGATPVNGSLVTADSVAREGAVSPNLCLAGSLDPARALGTIIVCERGVNDRLAKSAESKRVGAIGMVLVNVDPGSTDLDPHSVSTVHLDATYHAAVLAYAATAGATATLTPENTAGDTPPTPVVAGFSSRGPVLADGSDLLKPDIAAPGVAIIASGDNAADGEPTFTFLSGTSMAAPHIAGLGLLYLGVHPKATPAEIKSAMMTTAYDTKNGSGDTVSDPFAQGAGHADPTRYFAPGLLYLNGLDDWYSYIQGIGYDVGAEPIDPSNLNLPSIAIGSLTAAESITRTVTSTRAGTFDATVHVPGIDAVVSPSSLTFAAAGESKSFSITFNRTTAALDEFATGSLTWTSGETKVRSPIAIKPVTIVAPASAAGTGTSGAVDVTITLGGDGDIALTTTGLTAGVLQPDTSGNAPGHSGSSAVASSFEYLVQVAEGSKFARFDLDSIDDAADLDLVLYRLDAAGTPVAGWQSATGSADERVDLLAPLAGTYRAEVIVYSAPAPTAFDLKTYAVADGGESLSLSPDVLAGVQGVAATYTASWVGLSAFTSYLGLVDYGDTGVYTMLNVVTRGDVKPGTPIATAPPTISGTPAVGKTLKAKPGTWNTEGLRFAYQWNADGKPITKADRSSYTLTPKDQGMSISVTVTASKRGIPDGSAVSDAVIVKFTSKTELKLDRPVISPRQQQVATAKVTTGEKTLSAGIVVFRLDGRVVGEVEVAAGSSGAVTYTVPTQSSGRHFVTAEFVSDSGLVSGSTSAAKRYVVRG